MQEQLSVFVKTLSDKTVLNQRLKIITRFFLKILTLQTHSRQRSTKASRNNIALYLKKATIKPEKCFPANGNVHLAHFAA